MLYTSVPDTVRGGRAAVPRGVLGALLGLLLLLPSPVQAQPAGRRGAVVGQVLDAATGQPVEWTQLLLEEANRSTAAREEGRFELVNVPAGTYTLKTYRVGYEPMIRTVRVPAGDTLRLTLHLTSSPVTTGELVVEDAREPAGQLADAAMEMEGRQLRQNLGTTIAETLKDEPGIAMRSMGPAPARPVLRGLGGERLLVLADGGRTGDLSATSSDHAVVIDPLSAERIEVVRGPAALVYGPNTLGGVVNVIRNYIPTSRPAGPEGGVSVQGESVNRGYAVGAGLEAPVGLLTVHADGSVRQSRDVHTPAGTLQNTALDTYSGTGGASLIRPWGYAGLAGSYYWSEYGIPGGFVGAHPHGVNIVLERRHLEGKAEVHPGLAWIPRVELKGSYSWFHQEEYEAGGTLGTEFGLLSYHGSIVAHTLQNGLVRKGAIGLWGEYRDYAAGGLIFTPASRDWTLAGFAYQDLHFRAWTLQAGLRFDYRQVAPREERVSRVIGAIRPRTFSGLSGSVAGLWHPAEQVTFGVTVMRSLRVPGIEELFSEGPHLASYSFEVGNPALAMERGWGTELSARYSGSRLSGSLALYRNQFGSYIYPRNTGELNPRTLLPVYQTTGAAALMWGGEASATVQLTRRVALEGSAGYVRGTFTDIDEPIPFIPPLSGRLGVRYDRRALTLGTTLRTAAAQDRVGEFEQPTDGYVVLDAFTQYHLTAGGLLHTIDLVLTNVADAEYRDHLSRVKRIMPQPGRNLKLLYKLYF